MNNNPKRDEERIGRLLADGLQYLAVEIPCLTEKQLDNLAAGTASTEEKERCYSHIAGCSVCNHAFVVMQRLAKADTTELSKHIRPAWSYIAPLTLAATVLLAVSLYRFLPSKSDVGAPLVAMNKPPINQGAIAQTPKPAPPSPLAATRHKSQMTRQESLLAMAENLGKAARGKELDIPLAAAGQAGFASDGAAEANRFHAGFALLSLGVACEAHDRNLTLRASASLRERLQRLDLPQEVMDKITHLAALLNETTDPKSYQDLSATVTAAMTARYSDDPYGELGVWTAGLRIAVQCRNAAYLRNGELSQLEVHIEKMRGQQRVVVGMISEIRSLAKGPLNDTAWERIDSLADDIQKQF
jgi:hypothetical protein